MLNEGWMQAWIPRPRALTMPACIPTDWLSLTPRPSRAVLQLNVSLAEEPALSAWRGGALLGASPEFVRLAVTQQEWKQYGAAAAAKWDL